MDSHPLTVQSNSGVNTLLSGVIWDKWEETSRINVFSCNSIVSPDPKPADAPSYFVPCWASSDSSPNMALDTRNGWGKLSLPFCQDEGLVLQDRDFLHPCTLLGLWPLKSRQIFHHEVWERLKAEKTPSPYFLATSVWSAEQKSPSTQVFSELQLERWIANKLHLSMRL